MKLRFLPENDGWVSVYDDSGKNGPGGSRLILRIKPIPGGIAGLKKLHPRDIDALCEKLKLISEVSVDDTPQGAPPKPPEPEALEV